MTVINLMIIASVVCFIVDISGVVDSIKKALWKKYVNAGDYQNLKLKPFECSLCMTWWITLIYIIATGHFTIPYIGLCALLSLLSSNITDALRLTKDLLAWIINQIYRIL